MIDSSISLTPIEVLELETYLRNNPSTGWIHSGGLWILTYTTPDGATAAKCGLTITPDGMLQIQAVDKPQDEVEAMVVSMLLLRTRYGERVRAQEVLLKSGMSEAEAVTVAQHLQNSAAVEGATHRIELGTYPLQRGGYVRLAYEGIANCFEVELSVPLGGSNSGGRMAFGSLLVGALRPTYGSAFELAKGLLDEGEK